MLHTTVSTSTCLHLENSSVETPPLWQITTTCNIQPKLFFTMRTSLLQGTIRYTPFSFCLFTVHSLDQPQYKQSLDQPIKSQSGYKTTHKIYTYSRKYCLQSVSTLLYHGLTATTSPSLYIYKEMEKQLTCIWNLHEQSPKETKTNNKYKIVTNVMKHIYILHWYILHIWWGTSQCNNQHWNKHKQKYPKKPLSYWKQRVLFFRRTLLFPSDHVSSLLLFLHASNLVSAEVILIVKTSWTFLIQISRFVKGPLREQAISHFGP